MPRKSSQSKQLTLEQINKVFNNKLIQHKNHLSSKWAYGKENTYVSFDKVIKVAKIAHSGSPHSAPKLKSKEYFEFNTLEELEEWLKG